MNIVLNIGVSALGYAFPQLQASIYAYRWGKTAASVGKLAFNFFTGNWAALGIGLFSASSDEDACLHAYDWCMASEDNGIMGDGGIGVWAVQCGVQLARCIAKIVRG